MMTKNTTINLRVNSETKEEAGQILAEMGLTFSDAFDLLLHQILLQERLPFEIVAYRQTPKPETLALIERIENGREALTGPFSSKEELWRSLGI